MYAAIIKTSLNAVFARLNDIYNNMYISKTQKNTPQTIFNSWIYKNIYKYIKRLKTQKKPAIIAS